jgi:non-haem Fe2+, alpha-ketoglutarate-dependent halogenase
MNTTPTFNPIPANDVLGRMPRDLHFHPCSNTQPKVLSLDQIARFNTNGYLMPFRFFAPNEIAEIRTYFDKLLAEYLAAGKDSYSISTAHLRHGRVYDILTNPRIVGVVRDLIGPNVVAWGSHFFCKMPGDGKSVAWHQDASYWP